MSVIALHLQKSCEGLAFCDCWYWIMGLINIDIASEELRHSIRALRRWLVGLTWQNLLDVIFSSFCLGK